MHLSAGGHPEGAALRGRAESAARGARWADRGVEARALLVNAADDVRFASDALALPDDPQLGNR